MLEHSIEREKNLEIKRTCDAQMDTLGEAEFLIDK